MRRCIVCKTRVGVVVAAGTLAWAMAGIPSCGTAPTPFVVHGPGVTGNEPPQLEFLEPSQNTTLSLGTNFVVRWTDSDRDSSALIEFALVNVETNQQIVLERDIPENDQEGPDARTYDTGLVPVGRYNLLGTIDDGSNPAVSVFARTITAGVEQRLVLNITEPGQGPQTRPPVITVTRPAFNLSVAQDDELLVEVQPSALVPNANNPYDPDSDIVLYIVLDVDLDPNNDDPANPDASRIIVLRTTVVTAGSFEAIRFAIPIDLDVVPPRADGTPYFIRATSDDLTNPRVHRYAVGTISVVQLASGVVDLFDIGRTKSGVRFYGFSPGANLGSSMSTMGDFDADGVDDFILVAQFGNPRNLGPVGEAYGVYGQDGIRFGGTASVNSVGEAVSGVIFEAPPIRPLNFFDELDLDARTDGISDVSVIQDLSGDGRPDILFGLQHVHGAFEAMDWDPGDTDPTSLPEGQSNIGCYPDALVNNRTDEFTGVGLVDVYEYAGGMALVLNSQNRALDGFINPLRLERTTIALELVGAKQTAFALPGPIFARAHNASADPLDGETAEEDRISGARFVAGGYDYIDAFGQRQPGRDGLWGQAVSSIGDQNNDDFDEIMISAPRNERYLAILFNEFTFPTQRFSTSFFGSITVISGFNYNTDDWRDIADASSGTSTIPFLDHHLGGLAPFGTCSTPVVPRHTFVPADHFSVFAEDSDDMLGGARSAGDFNQDGIDEILCGAPLNDRSPSLLDTGAAYVIYGRNVFGDFFLDRADDPILRPPMLRIRGVKPGDRIGWVQAGGLDVNGDRVGDVAIASPNVDFGGITRSVCSGDFNGDGVIDSRDLSSAGFESCTQESEIFSDDACKAFDYDNSGLVDERDRTVFDCLFAGGTGCCENAVDNGFVGIIFGGVFIDGDRTINQLATSDLPGTVFFGSNAGDRAGTDVSSAGDFNKDNFGDILIAAPGETRLDSSGRERLGVVYLIYGGTHLRNTKWNLSQVGTDDLPGVVFLSPYVKGRPNEAAPVRAAGIGDINNDGFDDIAIGNPFADFIDLTFPQGPDATDAEVGRRRNAGDAYIVYGNNFGSNRGGG